MTTVQLIGKSGLALNFTVLPRNVDWNDTAGLYAFVQELPRAYNLKYIGICDSFRRRMANHERWNEVARLGANVVLAVMQSNAIYRAAYERDLIARYNPPLNEHHRSDAQQFGLLGLGALSRR